MDDHTLILECWSDDLSPAQTAAFDKAKLEQKTITDKINDLIKDQAGEELFIGEVFSAYQFQGKIQSIPDTYIVKVPTKYKSQKKSSVTYGGISRDDQQLTSRSIKRKAAMAVTNVILDDDDDDDVPLTKRISKRDKDYSPSVSKSSRNQIQQLPPTPTYSKDKKKSKFNDKEKVVTTFRPSEITSIGGLTIGLNKDDSKSNDQKDAAKLQGKTFPSLVVVAKPHLKVKEQSGTERSALDSKVKVVLMLTPAKFTEWLIQQGLLKSEQRCALHPNNELKLGVYSDGSKFPYSGGYVWISECCPTRFISVFHGSLFEGAPHPPSCILKLIYHWACQTNIQNVVQWVKVDNLYIKGVYTWLRAICTLALNKHSGLMGGAGKCVEVGVISLGTTAQDGQQRQVKVEVLGVLDSEEKSVRLRAIEPFTDNERGYYKRRFAKILEPLTDWVLKDSIIVIDLTVDKATLNSMGYKNVLQVSANDTTAKHSNAMIMDYLRRIVPRMFQNTLSLLSRQMIQQFLDELVWREQFGTYPLQAFDSITAHLAEQTRIDTKDTLTQRLYQVATNPFKNWTNFEMNSTFSSSKDASKRSKKLIGKIPNAADVVAKATRINAPSSSASSRRESATAQQTSHKKSSSSSSGGTSSTNAITAHVETKGLEDIYYGILPENEDMLYNIEKNPDMNIDLNCPCCSETFKTNSLLQADILRHIDIDTKTEDYKHQCIYCLEKLPSERSLKRHELLMHPSVTKHSTSVSYNCLLCQNRFNTVQLLSTHLQRMHVIQELPYCCNACGYRTSSHHNIVQHFYRAHENENMLQCPLCLAVYWIFSKGEVDFDNIKQFYNHMHRHFEKSNNKKCNKCVLTFITKGDLKYHMSKDHYSYSGIPKVCTLTNSTIKIPIPKYKSSASKMTISHKTLEEYPSLVLNLSGGKLCLECDRDLDEGIHISGFHKCNKCEYKTCCLRAIFEHTSSCPSTNALFDSNDFIKLDTEMHCVCGFSSSEGNSMARHLIACEHKSAYPSVECAQENTVKRNMLDMLGLVRREGEGGNDGTGGSDAVDANDGAGSSGVGGGDDGEPTNDEVNEESTIEKSTNNYDSIENNDIEMLSQTDNENQLDTSVQESEPVPQIELDNIEEKQSEQEENLSIINETPDQEMIEQSSPIYPGRDLPQLD